MNTAWPFKRRGQRDVLNSEALSRNAAALSLQCATLCREHTEHMRELEVHTLRAENKSC